MTKITTRCPGCDRVQADGRPGWWMLSNYHGLSGMFCGSCYDKVAHDSYDRAEQPEEYLLMLLKLGGTR